MFYAVNENIRMQEMIYLDFLNFSRNRQLFNDLIFGRIDTDRRTFTAILDENEWFIKRMEGEFEIREGFMREIQSVKKDMGIYI